MTKRILVAVSLFASAFALQAENVYSVKTDDKQIVPLGLISLPATITGRVSSAKSEHRVSFQVSSYYGKQLAGIYTNTGTGAVFKAYLRMGQERDVEITSPQDVVFDDDISYVLTILADKYQEGASYAVRLGAFGDFSVSFNGNGGNVSSNKMVYTPGQPYGKFPTATRTNYVHTGWSTAAKNGVVLSPSTPVCLGYTTLYAQWKASSVAPTNETPAVTNYYVAFNANGGTGTMSNQTFTVGVAQALKKNAFRYNGYDFRGWATSSAGSVEYADGAVVTNLTTAGSTRTLYASWVISSDLILSQEINGVTWHYTATNGVATIQNVSGGAYVAAVDTSVRGTLTIPAVIGANTVEKIGERAFAGCASVTNIVIPLGVTTIGSQAFAGCTNLTPGITIPESVETMGSYVFANCPALKIVRYLGDCPEADESLYAGAPSSLISGALRVRTGWTVQDSDEEPSMSEDVDDKADGDDADAPDASDDAGGDEGGGDDADADAVTWHASLPASWPADGAHSRRVFWLTDQPVYKVVFWDVPGISKTAHIQYYIPDRVLELWEEEPEREGYTFLGWFTMPYGGEEVTDDVAEETVVNKSFSLYAHWQNQDDPESLAEVEYDFSATHVYEGYLLDSDGDMAGTIQLKTSKGKWNRADEETNVTASATIVMLGEGSIRLKGVLGEDLSGTLTPSRRTDERELEVTVSGSGMEGTFEDYTVMGTRDIFGKKTHFDRIRALAADDNWKGYYVVVLKAESDESSLGNGYAGLSVQVKANGKARVTGTMPDGTKLTYNGRMEVLDDGCVLPVIVPLHKSRRGGFGFLLSFSEDLGVSVSSVSSWSNTSVPFNSALTEVGAAKVAEMLTDATFSLEDVFEIDDVEIDESLLPEDVAVAVSGARWLTPRGDRVKFVADDAAYEVQTEYGNPSGLSLSAKPALGTFLGRFKVFAVTDAGRSKKYTATVTGAVLEGVGYGTATIKKIGAVPVTVKAE